MNQTGKTLLSALIISLFSLATLQGYRIIAQESSSTQVLGDTTVKSVPCTVINSWQKQYCSVGSTTPTPSPTITSTKPLITSANPNPGTAGKSICLYGSNFTRSDIGSSSPSQAYFVSATGKNLKGSFGFYYNDPRGIGWSWYFEQVCFYLPSNLPTDTYNFNICVLNQCSVPGINIIVNAK